MNWRDVRNGMTVYNCVYTHWGKGTVLDVVSCDSLERMFERGNRRVLVQYEGVERPVRQQLCEIRKTPNKKKIREMVELYPKRGVDAVDGGDRLIMPAAVE